ncbi:hypothetical protein M569_08775 [Genlisea aurea]|uniref:YqaJ viral recombinase domain-containing protein n=1 Tax=Genlisea aurea TaxID=192259 RepID=S8CMI8_9LAMI|nr:hypothetical protein M569_08775 [Genlisea aurea]
MFRKSCNSKWYNDHHPIGVLADLKSNNQLDRFKKQILHCSSRSYTDHPTTDRHSPEFFSSQTHPILRANQLQHWFKNWPHLRKDKLTASTFASAVGFWPRGRTRLWLEKLGVIEPFFGNLATCWSNIREQEALWSYQLITRNMLSFPCFRIYGGGSDYSFLAASPDGIIDGFPTSGILEIKCPFFGGDMRNATPWKRVPIHCIPQAQGLMSILDRDWMHIYVWTVNGSSLFRLERNVEYWDVLKVALSDFWWDHVQPAKEICSSCVIENPLVELRSLRPTAKHVLHQRITQESKRIVDSAELLFREIHRVHE